MLRRSLTFFNRRRIEFLYSRSGSRQNSRREVNRAMGAMSTDEHASRPGGAPADDRTFTPHPGRGLLFVLLSAVFFSSSGVLAKPVMLAGMTPQQVAAARIDRKSKRLNSSHVK